MRVALLTTLSDDLTARALGLLGREAAPLRDARGVEDAAGPRTVLIGFHTGVIVPPDVLRACAGAYNFHGATPVYPGRDPHHFAAYDGVTEWGATAHVMTDRVDAGAIVGVERRPVPSDAAPVTLLAIAVEASFALLERLAPAMARGEAIAPCGEVWSGVKRTRADFRAMCRIDPSMDAEELDRRIRAFHVDGYENLYTELHGRRFAYRPPTAQ